MNVANDKQARHRVFEVKELSIPFESLLHLQNACTLLQIHGFVNLIKTIGLLMRGVDVWST